MNTALSLKTSERSPRPSRGLCGSVFFSSRPDDSAETRTRARERRSCIKMSHGAGRNMACCNDFIANYLHIGWRERWSNWYTREATRSEDKAYGGRSPFYLQV